MQRLAPQPPLPAEFEYPKLIGQGGFGAVYSARWHGRRVALKVHFARTEPEAVTQVGWFSNEFAHEMDVGARVPICSRYVIRTLGVRTYPSVVLIQEYWGDRSDNTLQRWIEPGKSGVPHPTTLLDLAIQIASGLAELHAVGLAHCDIKPSNVMIQTDLDNKLGRLKRWHARIGDLGACRILGPHPRPDLRGKAITPRFAAPELLSDNPGLPSADVYSFGVLMLAMRQLLRDSQVEPTEDSEFWASEIASSYTSLSRSRQRGVRNRLSSLLKHCLQQSPSDRPSIKQVTATLKRIHSVVAGKWSPPNAESDLELRKEHTHVRKFADLTWESKAKTEPSNHKINRALLHRLHFYSAKCRTVAAADPEGLFYIGRGLLTDIFCCAELLDQYGLKLQRGAWRGNWFPDARSRSQIGTSALPLVTHSRTIFPINPLFTEAWENPDAVQCSNRYYETVSSRLREWRLALRHAARRVIQEQQSLALEICSEHSDALEFIAAEPGSLPSTLSVRRADPMLLQRRLYASREDPWSFANSAARIDYEFGLPILALIVPSNGSVFGTAAESTAALFHELEVELLRPLDSIEAGRLGFELSETATDSALSLLTSEAQPRRW